MQSFILKNSKRLLKIWKKYDRGLLFCRTLYSSYWLYFKRCRQTIPHRPTSTSSHQDSGSHWTSPTRNPRQPLTWASQCMPL